MRWLSGGSYAYHRAGPHAPRGQRWVITGRCIGESLAVVFDDHGIEMASAFVVVVKLLESSTILGFIVAITLKAGVVMPGYLSTSADLSTLVELLS